MKVRKKLYSTSSHCSFKLICAVVLSIMYLHHINFYPCYFSYEGGKEGGKEGWRERGREGGEGGKEGGGREGGREGGKEGGKNIYSTKNLVWISSSLSSISSLQCVCVYVCVTETLIK